VAFVLDLTERKEAEAELTARWVAAKRVEEAVAGVAPGTGSCKSRDIPLGAGCIHRPRGRPAAQRDRGQRRGLKSAGVSGRSAGGMHRRRRGWISTMRSMMLYPWISAKS
jgi:hypothetical protein